MADAGGKLKFLVPTNFSRNSDMALDFALTHAITVPAEVYLFYVLEDSTTNYRKLDKLNQQYMDRMKSQMMSAISRLQERGIRPNIEDVHRRISHGKAAKEIRSMAMGIAPDMIVMGAPSQSSFKRLTLRAPCTLVLVKDKAQL